MVSTQINQDSIFPFFKNFQKKASLMETGRIATMTFIRHLEVLQGNLPLMKFNTSLTTSEIKMGFWSKQILLFLMWKDEIKLHLLNQFCFIFVNITLRLKLGFHHLPQLTLYCLSTYPSIHLSIHPLFFIIIYSHF